MDSNTLERLLNKVDALQDDVYEVRTDLQLQKVLIEDQIEQHTEVANCIGRMDKNLEKLDILVGEYNKELQIHIAGVLELREANRIEREKLDMHKTLVAAQMADLQKPIIVAKGLAWLAGIAATVAGIYKMFWS